MNLELREFFATFTYQQLSEFAAAENAHGNPELAKKEQMDNIRYAAIAIPAVGDAFNGSLHAQELGDHETAALLRGQCLLLTGIYRIAQNMGYEWRQL